MLRGAFTAALGLLLGASGETGGDCASALLLSDGGGPSLASKLQGVVDALATFDSNIDEEAAAALAGADWESYAWAREAQPLQQAEIGDEEEGWMDNEGD